MSVWADGAWMLDDEPELADEIASLLALAPRGLSCDELAVRTARRRTAVLAALRSDPRFTRRSAGRGSRWLLIPPLWDGLGRIPSTSLNASVVPDRRDAQNGGERFEELNES